MASPIDFSTVGSLDSRGRRSSELRDMDLGPDGESDVAGGVSACDTRLGWAIIVATLGEAWTLLGSRVWTAAVLRVNRSVPDDA